MASTCLAQPITIISINTYYQLYTLDYAKLARSGPPCPCPTLSRVAQAAVPPTRSRTLANALVRIAVRSKTRSPPVHLLSSNHPRSDRTMLLPPHPSSSSLLSSTLRRSKYRWLRRAISTMHSTSRSCVATCRVARACPCRANIIDPHQVLAWPISKPASVLHFRGARLFKPPHELLCNPVGLPTFLAQKPRSPASRLSLHSRCT